MKWRFRQPAKSQLIERERKAVLKAQQRGELTPDWQSTHCQTQRGKTRVYLGRDDLIVPLTNDAEKQKRRGQMKQKI
jgi:hypothetical protein